MWASLIIAAVTAAAPDPVRWQYVRDDSAAACPTSEQLADQISARMGQSPFRPDAERTLRVTVRRRASFEAQLELLQGAQVVAHRALSSASTDCRELTDSIALAATLALDPLGLSRQEGHPQTPPTPPAVLPAPPPVVAPAQAPAPPPPLEPTHLWQLSTWLGPTGSLGSTPTVAWGGKLGVAASTQRVLLGIEASGAVSVYNTAVTGQFLSAPLLASALGCVRFGPAAVCARASAGALRLTGGSVDEQHTIAALVMVGARASVGLPLSTSLALRADLDLDAPLTRTKLTLGTDALWSTSPLAGDLAFCLVWTP